MRLFITTFAILILGCFFLAAWELKAPLIYQSLNISDLPSIKGTITDISCRQKTDTVPAIPGKPASGHKTSYEVCRYLATYSLPTKPQTTSTKGKDEITSGWIIYPRAFGKNTEQDSRELRSLSLKNGDSLDLKLTPNGDLLLPVLPQYQSNFYQDLWAGLSFVSIGLFFFIIGIVAYRRHF